MKKMVAALLVGVLCLGLAGCKNEPPPTPSDAGGGNSTTEAFSFEVSYSDFVAGLSSAVDALSWKQSEPTKTVVPDGALYIFNVDCVSTSIMVTVSTTKDEYIKNVSAYSDTLPYLRYISAHTIKQLKPSADADGILAEIGMGEEATESKGGFTSFENIACSLVALDSGKYDFSAYCVG